MSMCYLCTVLVCVIPTQALTGSGACSEAPHSLGTCGDHLMVNFELRVLGFTVSLAYEFGPLAEKLFNTDLGPLHWFFHFLNLNY